MKANLKPRVASATEVKNRFGDYLGEVIHGDHTVLIEKHGHPVAVLVSYDAWNRKDEDSKDLWIRSYRQLMEQIKKDKPSKHQTPAVDLINTTREEES